MRRSPPAVYRRLGSLTGAICARCLFRLLTLTHGCANPEYAFAIFVCIYLRRLQAQKCHEATVEPAVPHVTLNRAALGNSDAFRNLEFSTHGSTCQSLFTECQMVVMLTIVFS